MHHCKAGLADVRRSRIDVSRLFQTHSQNDWIMLPVQRRVMVHRAITQTLNWFSSRRGGEDVILSILWRRLPASCTGQRMWCLYKNPARLKFPSTSLLQGLTSYCLSGGGKGGGGTPLSIASLFQIIQTIYIRSREHRYLCFITNRTVSKNLSEKQKLGNIDGRYSDHISCIYSIGNLVLGNYIHNVKESN